MLLKNKLLVWIRSLSHNYFSLISVFFSACNLNNNSFIPYVVYLVIFSRQIIVIHFLYQREFAS